MGFHSPCTDGLSVCHHFLNFFTLCPEESLSSSACSCPVEVNTKGQYKEEGACLYGVGTQCGLNSSRLPAAQTILFCPPHIRGH